MLPLQLLLMLPLLLLLPPPHSLLPAQAAPHPHTNAYLLPLIIENPPLLLKLPQESCSARTEGQDCRLAVRLLLLSLRACDDSGRQRRRQRRTFWTSCNRGLVSASIALLHLSLVPMAISTRSGVTGPFTRALPELMHLTLSLQSK